MLLWRRAYFQTANENAFTEVMKNHMIETMTKYVSILCNRYNRVPVTLYRFFGSCSINIFVTEDYFITLVPNYDPKKTEWDLF